MRALADRLVSARRKGLFRSRPVFERYVAASDTDISSIEARIGRSLPEDLQTWLKLVGFGDIDASLSFRAEWFNPVEYGHLKGGFLFAQDELGNFYACAPDGDGVIFFSRSEPGYVVLSPSFAAFIEELERRDYKAIEWAESVELKPYAWAAV